MKNDPNWNLRFPRSSREAFGSSMEPDAHRGDWAVWVIAAFCAGFLLGLGVVA